jgi:hypothetical protein
MSRARVRVNPVKWGDQGLAISLLQGRFGTRNNPSSRKILLTQRLLRQPIWISSVKGVTNVSLVRSSTHEFVDQFANSKGL